jgi:hypothetical protein
MVFQTRKQAQECKFFNRHNQEAITKNLNFTCDRVLPLLSAISPREFNKGSSPGRICLNKKALQKKRSLLWDKQSISNLILSHV